MKRAIIILAVLLLAAPAFATVTITAKHIGLPLKAGVSCTTVEVNYVCSAGEKLRAFALDINVDNGFTIDNIRDFNRGESNKAPMVNPGYGVFPGKFRDVINPADPNWVNPNYNPIAPVGDLNAATGLGTGAITVEMGTLYLGDNNAPPSSGVLFRFDVNTQDRTPIDCNLTIALNTTRGGVVDINGTKLTPTLVGGKVSFPECFPCWTPFDIQYSEWLSVWKPNCWCGYHILPYDPNARFQCYGDADGKVETAFKYRVYTSDYSKLFACWRTKATQIKPPSDCACIDFDHRSETAFKYRVYTSDYTRLFANWRKKDTQLNPPCPIVY